MVVMECRKLKCDECGKIVEVDGGGSYPVGWFVLDVVEWSGSSGEGRWNKEVCSEECAIKSWHKLKKLPPRPSVCIY